MTSRVPDPPSELEDEGIPDMQDVEPAQLAAGDTHEMQQPPRDHAIAADDFGTTVEEMREGESLDGRLARELPDLPERGRDEAHRLVQPDQGTGDDDEGTEVAYDAGADTGGLSPEERAVHVEPEPEG